MTLDYSFTNESLDAIISGLQLNENDKILSIGGSGDQAFAMIEYGGYVRAVDRVEPQVELMEKRLAHLRKGDFESFLKIDQKGAADGFLDGAYSKETEKLLIDRRNGYFSKAGRLNRIKENSWGLVISNPADITEMARQERWFNKVYFSNALSGYCGLPELLLKVSNNLPSGGLIYVSNHDFLRESISPRNLKWTNRPNIEIDEINDGSFLPLTLILDDDLTRETRKTEHLIWKPAVYRKI